MAAHSCQEEGRDIPKDSPIACSVFCELVNIASVFLYTELEALDVACSEEITCRLAVSDCGLLAQTASCTKSCAVLRCALLPMKAKEWRSGMM